MEYRGDPLVYQTLNELNIPFEYYEHPEAPTVEIASKYWEGINSSHCKISFSGTTKGTGTTW